MKPEWLIHATGTPLTPKNVDRIIAWVPLFIRRAYRIKLKGFSTKRPDRPSGGIYDLKYTEAHEIPEDQWAV